MSEFEIKLDEKFSADLTEDDSVFYRFNLTGDRLLGGKVIFWFSLYNNKDIYSIGVNTENLFPVTGTMLFADTDMERPFYFKKVLINPHTLNGDIDRTQRYINELQLACDIGRRIEDFFNNEFLQNYT